MEKAKHSLKSAARLLLERAPKIQGLDEYTLETLRLVADGDDPTPSLNVSFRRGARGEVPSVDLSVRLLSFSGDELQVTVNHSTSGAVPVERARDFADLLLDVVFLAEIVEMEISPCPHCGGLTDRDGGGERYCTECGEALEDGGER